VDDAVVDGGCRVAAAEFGTVAVVVERLQAQLLTPMPRDACGTGLR
jgi:hypothetical protein